jgi:hypothetical protein
VFSTAAFSQSSKVNVIYSAQAAWCSTLELTFETALGSLFVVTLTLLRIGILVCHSAYRCRAEVYLWCLAINS